MKINNTIKVNFLLFFLILVILGTLFCVACIQKSVMEKQDIQIEKRDSLIREILCTEAQK